MRTESVNAYVSSNRTAMAFLAILALFFLLNFAIPKRLANRPAATVSRFSINQYLAFPGGTIRPFLPTSANTPNPIRQLTNGETVTVVLVDDAGRQLSNLLRISLFITDDIPSEARPSPWPMLGFTVITGQQDVTEKTEGAFALTTPGIRLVIEGKTALCPNLTPKLRQGAAPSWRDDAPRVADCLNNLAVSFFREIKRQTPAPPVGSI